MSSGTWLDLLSIGLRKRKHAKRTMPYIVSWTGPNGLERKKAQTAAEALRWWTTYNREAAKMVIKNDTGQRVTPDDLARLVDRGG